MFNTQYECENCGNLITSAEAEHNDGLCNECYDNTLGNDVSEIETAKDAANAKLDYDDQFNSDKDRF